MHVRLTYCPCCLLLTILFDDQPIRGAQGMLAHVLGSLGGACGSVLAYALLLVVRPAPGWDARYALPLLAAMLGSALSGVSAGLSARCRGAHAGCACLGA